MMLRISLQSKRVMAENGMMAIACFANGDFGSSFGLATMRGFGLVRISPFISTLSLDGQHKDPLAMLSVLLGRCVSRLARADILLSMVPLLPFSHSLNTRAHVRSYSYACIVLVSFWHKASRFCNLFHHQKGPAYV